MCISPACDVAPEHKTESFLRFNVVPLKKVHIEELDIDNISDEVYEKASRENNPKPKNLAKFIKGISQNNNIIIIDNGKAIPLEPENKSSFECHANDKGLFKSEGGSLTLVYQYVAQKKKKLRVVT